MEQAAFPREGSIIKYTSLKDQNVSHVNLFSLRPLTNDDCRVIK